MNCFTEGENIPNIWYYDTDEYSLVNITGQSVQIPNRMNKWRRVHDNYIFLLCGKEDEDDYKLYGMGEIVLDFSFHSNILLSGEWIGVNRSNSRRIHQYNITLISKSVFAESEKGFRNSSQPYGYPGNITNLPEVEFLLDTKSSQIILILVLILTGMSFLFSIWKCLKRFCLNLKCKNRQREVQLRNFHINESVDVNQNPVETLNMRVVSTNSLQPLHTEIEPNLSVHQEDKVNVVESENDADDILEPEQAGLRSSTQIYHSPTNCNQDILPQEWSNQGASRWSNPSVTAGHWIHESLQDDQRELPGEVDSVVRTFSTLYYCLENTEPESFRAAEKVISDSPGNMAKANQTPTMENDRDEEITENIQVSRGSSMRQQRAALPNDTLKQRTSPMYASTFPKQRRSQDESTKPVSPLIYENIDQSVSLSVRNCDGGFNPSEDDTLDHASEGYGDVTGILQHKDELRKQPCSELSLVSDPIYSHSALMIDPNLTPSFSASDTIIESSPSSPSYDNLRRPPIERLLSGEK